MTQTQIKEYRPAKQSASFWKTVGIPARGEQLHNVLSEGISFDVYKQLAKISGFEQKKLAEYTRIPPATLSRRARSGRFKPDESDRLYRFAEVFKAAKDLFEGEQDAARAWLSHPVRGLGGRRPVGMIGSSAETETILDLIGRLEHGVFV